MAVKTIKVNSLRKKVFKKLWHLTNTKYMSK